jgi:hypothetical protein
MVRKALRERGWEQIESERAIVSGKRPDAQTAADKMTHARITDLACKNIILGSYKDV